jgi:hypothetical protein
MLFQYAAVNGGVIHVLARRYDPAGIAEETRILSAERFVRENVALRIRVIED